MILDSLDHQRYGISMRKLSRRTQKELKYGPTLNELSGEDCVASRAMLRIQLRNPRLLKKHEDIGWILALQPLARPLANELKQMTLEYPPTDSKDSKALLAKLESTETGLFGIMEEAAQWIRKAVLLPAGQVMLTRAITLLDERIAQVGGKTAQTEHMLASLFELNELERNFLQLAMAVQSTEIAQPLPELSSEWRSTSMALAAMLETPAPEIIRILSPTGRLCRSGLFEYVGSHRGRDLSDCLQLSPISNHLVWARCGSTQQALEFTLGAPLPVNDRRLDWRHLESELRLATTFLRSALKDQTRGVNILLHGAPGTGKTEFARQIAAELGVPLYAVPGTSPDGEALGKTGRLQALGLAQRFAQSASPVLMLLDEAEDIFCENYFSFFTSPDRRNESKAAMNQTLETNEVPVIWISNRIDNMDPAYIRRFQFCIEFKAVPINIRHSWVESHFEGIPLSPQSHHRLVSSPSATPAAMASCARFARMVAQGDSTLSDRAVSEQLGQYLRAVGADSGSSLPDSVTRFDPKYLNVSNAVTPDAVAHAIARSGTGSLLLSGPPGTGKTQFAGYVATLLKRSIEYRTVSDINDKFFGESERNVARLFDSCDPQAQVLFLDEADSLLMDRASSGNRPERAVTNEFLRRLESFKGVFIAATNFGPSIDSALLRRFRFRLEFLPLNFNQRLALLSELYGPLEEGNPDWARASQALKSLDTLTPGDFANVRRRFELLAVEAGPLDWIAELRAEASSRKGGLQQTMGFLQAD